MRAQGKQKIGYIEAKQENTKYERDGIHKLKNVQ